MIRLAAGVAAAKAVGTLARTAGRGGGTSLPGKVLTRVEPHAISRLASRLDRGSVVISATNGKTTTAAMVASILGRTGARLVHNRAGANMAGGIASALASASRRGGRTLTGDFGLFEVDEFWLGPVAEELEPRAMLLGNLFRDQLDRYGELEVIADRWAVITANRKGLVLNADDPLIADLGRAPAPWPPEEGERDEPRAGVVYFGVDDDSLALPQLQHASDSKHCRRCGHAYAYAAVYLAHLGHYKCPNCGRERPEPDVVGTDVELNGIRSAAFTLQGRRVNLPLPGLYNVYNALGAAALTLSLGVTLDDVVAGLESVAPAFGRAETLDLGRPTSLLLVKNPAGANEVLRTLALEGTELDLLGVLNDRTADGRDVSWVWDADWELLAGHVRRFTAAGTRAAELALRMKYAGLALDRIHVAEDLEIRPRRGAQGRRRPALRHPDLHRAARAARDPHPPRPREGVLGMTPEHAVWHDVECGGYTADLEFWHELAREADDGILDVGAGTGRVALTLARAGHAVTALDLDPELLAVLRERAGDLPIATLAADAADFTLEAPVSLIAVPMQTIQLLPERSGFFACARRALAPGGRIALAIATDLEPYDGAPPLPAPDLGARDGWTYISQPVAIRVGDGRVAIERIRHRIGPDDERETTENRIELAVVTPGGLAEEAAEHGLEAEELRWIPETEEHVASQVVLFRG